MRHSQTACDAADEEAERVACGVVLDARGPQLGQAREVDRGVR